MFKEQWNYNAIREVQIAGYSFKVFTLKSFKDAKGEYEDYIIDCFQRTENCSGEFIIYNGKPYFLRKITDNILKDVFTACTTRIIGKGKIRNSIVSGTIDISNSEIDNCIIVGSKKTVVTGECTGRPLIFCDCNKADLSYDRYEIGRFLKDEDVISKIISDCKGDLTLVSVNSGNYSYGAGMRVEDILLMYVPNLIVCRQELSSILSNIKCETYEKSQRLISCKTSIGDRNLYITNVHMFRKDDNMNSMFKSYCKKFYDGYDDTIICGDFNNVNVEGIQEGRELKSGVDELYIKSKNFRFINKTFNICNPDKHKMIISNISLNKQEKLSGIQQLYNLNKVLT